MIDYIIYLILMSKSPPVNLYLRELLTDFLFYIHVNYWQTDFLFYIHVNYWQISSFISTWTTDIFPLLYPRELLTDFLSL
jgi:hypothetical protein